MINTRSQPLVMRQCPKCEQEHPATLIQPTGLCVYCTQAKVMAETPERTPDGPPSRTRWPRAGATPAHQVRKEARTGQDRGAEAGPGQPDHQPATPPAKRVLDAKTQQKVAKATSAPPPLAVSRTGRATSVWTSTA